ncbi:hypothetical protein FKW77_009665 [Venturia effusa]|uniref:Uncharacterized protein n=1 Tax=Venturia effusa TaxID=50376 RepID=A0A517L224_9PEZI|nr:hypothetical protein FKW77_009665 [Venturia effusa]
MASAAKSSSAMCPSPPSPPEVSGFLTRPKEEFRWPPKLAPPGFRQPDDQQEREEWLARKVSKDTVDAAGILGERAPLLPSPPPPEEEKAFCEKMANCSQLPKFPLDKPASCSNERDMPTIRHDSQAHIDHRTEREVHPPRSSLLVNGRRPAKEQQQPEMRFCQQAEKERVDKKHQAVSKTHG